ncbi:OmpA/MotB family protein [Thermodesulfitimonas autotrophica]|uniref:OmpA/MotB family protein n=1 Tax=Thermodesulfitimonas autotrophica TaxID=1894989 RepID=UPI002FE1A75D
MKRHKKPEKEANHERWLITYADLITLLLIFFIVLWTFSNIDAKKFAGIAESLAKALGGGAGMVLEGPGPSVVAGAPVSEDRVETKFSLSAEAKENLQLQKIKEQIEKYAKEQGLAGKVTARIEERGVVVSIQETVLFPLGSAELTPQAREIVRKVGQILLTTDNYIRVEGHTCDLPIHTARFPSNWELSVARATSVVEELLHAVHFPPERLAASGYAEYRPIAPNNSEANRQRNRRVDFVVLRSRYKETEPGVLPEFFYAKPKITP